MRKEFTRRIKEVIASKLKGGDVVKAIKCWAVSLLPYSGGVVRWTKNELANLNHKTRKLLTWRSLP